MQFSRQGYWSELLSPSPTLRFYHIRRIFKKSEFQDRKQLCLWFSPINLVAFMPTVQKISILLFKRTFVFSLAARNNCLLPWKTESWLYTGWINTIKWRRKGVIRELYIMAVRLALKSSSGCECLSWKRLFWEKTNSGEKVGESWGMRKEEDLYKWFARLPACCCGEESWADQDYCSQWQGKDQASGWMGWHSFPQDSRQPCLHLTIHVYKYSLSISCMCKADGDTGGRQAMKG